MGKWDKLSILSQLLLSSTQDSIAGWYPGFQFFPSCFWGAIYRAEPRLVLVLSILSQLLLAEQILASVLATNHSPFQFFPSCFAINDSSPVPLAYTANFQFFPSCFLTASSASSLPSLMYHCLSILSQLLPDAPGPLLRAAPGRQLSILSQLLREGGVVFSWMLEKTSFNSFPVASASFWISTVNTQTYR